MRKKEVWKDVIDFEGLYEVSNLGKIRSIRRRVYVEKREKFIILREKLLSQANCGDYKVVTLHKERRAKTFYVHRLVALNFVTRDNENMEVNHKDGVKSNNESENLQWVTRSQNMIHAYENNLQLPKRGADNIMFGNPKGLNRKKVSQFTRNGVLLKEYSSVTEAARKVQIHQSGISKALSKGIFAAGFRWEYSS